jgi:rfaE bifunctional protein kinase chain/domain
MNNDSLRKLLDDIKRSRIAIVGDFCLDSYWFIDESMSEISVETNLATRPVSEQRYSLGGAGNVANNLADLGVKDIIVFGVTGDDPFGYEMKRIMKQKGIRTENLLVQDKDWATHTYSKPYIGSNELNRIDFGNFNKLSRETADLLIENLGKTCREADIIIINQQVPSGIHTEYLRKRLVEVIKSFPGKTFIADSRSFNDYYEGSMRKMNDTEALRLCGQHREPDQSISLAELEPAAKELYKRFRKPLFITRGSRGSVISDESGMTEIPGLMILSRVDTVGAGDSYLAGAAAALAAGYCIQEAAYLGTLVAGVTVQKLFQTGTANPDEIMAIGNDPDLIYEPDLAETIRHAKYIEGTEIELINKWSSELTIEHAIFDHDGTISTLRQGWELIMAPVMMRSILGKKYETADDSLFRSIKHRVEEFIDKTTGIQTLAQMQGLADMVREFGIVPESEILDSHGYKKIFNDELLEMVKQRELKFRKGELSIEDLTIKNVIPFLERLHDAGIKLYLASGTDMEDVKNEANALGYAHLFEGRIFGSVGDINKEAKKMVLDQILDLIGKTSSGRIITFGDGPVEIRETRKRNGLTVGVASDEIRRYGLNEHKRTRLVKAGADLIIPDFSQNEQLLKIMHL